MELAILRQLLKNLTEKQKGIVNYYHENNMSKLREICDPIIYRKGVPMMDWGELYDVASDTLLESLLSYDDSKGCRFKTYLTGNINRAFYDWTRNNTRLCRCNIQTDKGRIVRNKDGNVVVIPSISFDAPLEDGIDLKEKIASNFNIEDNLSEEIGLSADERVDKYLNRLSKRQRKIVLLLSDGYLQDEIREILHISKKEYTDDLLSIRAYENIRILL